MKPRTNLTRALAAAFLLAIIPAAVQAQSSSPLKQSGKLVYPDGKPATDAVLIMDVVNNTTHAVTTTTYKPDPTGSVSFTIDRSLYKVGALVMFLISPTGTGFWAYGGPNAQSISTLQPFTSLRVRLVDADGHPIAHARICPRSLQMGRAYGSWDEFLPGDWNQTTDSAGYATLTKLPQGFKLGLNIADDRYILLDTKSLITLATNAVTPDATVQVGPASSISGSVQFDKTNKPVAGILVRAYPADRTAQGSTAVTGSDGSYTIGRLTAGIYTLVPIDRTEKLTDWIGRQQDVKVDAGAHTELPVLSLVHGGLINGKVTDKTTGKPVPNIMINVNIQGVASTYGREMAIVTAADGTYTARTVPGKIAVWPYSPANWMNTPVTKTIDIAEGETKTADFQIDAPILPAPVHGLVLDPNGKPASGAEVIGYQDRQPPEKAIADSQGRFTLDAPGLVPQSTILARSGDLSTAQAVVYNGEQNVTLHLTTGNLCMLTGQVQDQDGKPLPNAPVMLLHMEDNAGFVVDQAQCDATGHYTFPHAFGNMKYSIDASPTGYASASTNSIDVTSGQNVQFPPIMAQITDSFIGGTVLDIKGNPVANATVNGGSSGANTVTDSAGHFMITGVSREPGYIWVQPYNGMPYGFQVNSGRSDNTITLPSPVHGIVLGPDGKPVSGAQIFTFGQNQGDQPTTTDSTGHFTIDSPGLRLKQSILARVGNLGTPRAFVYNGEDAITLQLAEGVLSAIHGTVKNTDGTPIPEAAVTLVLESNYSGSQIGSTQTDSQGQYNFPPTFTSFKYSVRVEAPGHGSSYIESIAANPGQTTQIPTITLKLADTFVGGTVVDAKGNPVPGITVICADVKNVQSTTDQSGHFMLKGVPRDKTSVYYQAPSGAMEISDLTSGRGDNIIYLNKPDNQK